MNRKQAYTEANERHDKSVRGEPGVCCHCGTTEGDLSWGVYWIDYRVLCKPCRNKYDKLRSEQHHALSKFFRKPVASEG